MNHLKQREILEASEAGQLTPELLNEIINRTIRVEKWL